VILFLQGTPDKKFCAMLCSKIKQNPYALRKNALIPFGFTAVLMLF